MNTNIDQETREKLINLAAGLFAQWKYDEANLDYFDAGRYHEKYDGARQMAAILGITEAEIEKRAWDKWAYAIGEAYEANHNTF